MPAYNAVKHLDRSIGCILNQTYTNFELIVVDDGSTDDTLKKLSEFASKDNRIRVIAKEHAGVSSARNLGLKNATGAYIKFNDADDDMPEYALERFVKLIEKYDADAVSSRFSHPCLKQMLPDAVYDLTKKSDLIAYALDFGAGTMPWNKLYRREVLTEPFDENVHVTEDELYNFANLKNLKKVVTTTDVLYRYYVAPPDPNAPLSALQKIMSGEFWTTNSTQWYMAKQLYPLKQKYAQAFPADIRDDLATGRLCDFFFWETILLVGLATPTNVAKEVKRILLEDLFVFTMKTKEKYGIHFSPLTETEAWNKGLQFVNFICNTISKMQNEKLNYELIDIVIMAFIKIFCNVAEDIHDYDIIGRRAKMLSDNKTDEAKYVNSLL